MEKYINAGKTLRTKANVGKDPMTDIDLGGKEFIAEDYWINISPYTSWKDSKPQ